jgi:hypothetical protein
MRASLLAALAALAAAGCADRTTLPDDGVEIPLVPTAAGTRWTYQLSDSVELGSPAVAAPAFADVVLSRDTLVGLERWTAAVDTAHVFTITPAPFLANRRDGLFEFSPQGTPGVPRTGYDIQFLRFPYPTRVGVRFRIGDAVVSSVDTVVTVPAGAFHTLRYDLSARDGTTESYFIAPGTGVVMRVSFPIQQRDASGAVVSRMREVARLAAFTRP